MPTTCIHAGHAGLGGFGKEEDLEGMDDTGQKEEASEKDEQEVETLCKR